MLASLTIVAHDYFITKQSIGNLHVHIRREMRRTPFIGMKQPAPHNSIMGIDVVMILKFKGQNAIGYNWTLIKEQVIIQKGMTDHNGISSGIDIEFSNGLCQCQPQWFRDNSPFNEMRFCDTVLPKYQIEIEEPDTPGLTREAFLGLSEPQDIFNTANKPF